MAESWCFISVKLRTHSAPRGGQRHGFVWPLNTACSGVCTATSEGVHSKSTNRGALVIIAGNFHACPDKCIKKNHSLCRKKNSLGHGLNFEVSSRLSLVRGTKFTLGTLDLKLLEQTHNVFSVLNSIDVEIYSRALVNILQSSICSALNKRHR